MGLEADGLGADILDFSICPTTVMPQATEFSGSIRSGFQTDYGKAVPPPASGLSAPLVSGSTP